MKKSMKILVMAVIMIAAFEMNKATAQDMVQTNPRNTKVLCDTAGVRMTLVWLKPGEKLALHTHPFQEMYCLQSGQLTVYHKGGSTDVLNLKKGQALQGGPEIAHTSKNTGTTPLKIILVEFKK
jgi:quercetin dioxygenase-like cupin family protein